MRPALTDDLIETIRGRQGRGGTGKGLGGGVQETDAKPSRDIKILFKKTMGSETMSIFFTAKFEILYSPDMLSGDDSGRGPPKKRETFKREINNLVINQASRSMGGFGDLAINILPKEKNCSEYLYGKEFRESFATNYEVSKKDLRRDLRDENRGKNPCSEGRVPAGGSGG